MRPGRLSCAGMLLMLPWWVLAQDLPRERQTALKALLHQDCGSCHGMTLQGGLGPSLLAKDLGNKPDEFLIETILNGRPGTAMPPWNSLLTRDEATWLVRMLRSGSENSPSHP